MGLLEHNELVINLEVLTEGTIVLYKGKEYEWHEGGLYDPETNTVL
jgi:hypothetical protein